MRSERRVSRTLSPRIRAFRDVAALVCVLTLLAGCDVDIPRERSAYAHEDLNARLTARCDPKDPKACDDDNPCTDQTCDAVTGCAYVPTTSLCNDANPCTTDDACKDAVCTGNTLVCDDQNPCTADSCKPDSGCVHLAVPGACDDNDICTDNDQCSDVVCAGEPKVCDDGDPCTADTCDKAAATAKDACKNAASASVCDDENPCTDDTCTPGTGCSHTSNTAPCGGDDACVAQQVCASGACSKGVAVDCSDNNPCTDDSCDAATGCDHVNNTIGCDDGKPCTGDDVCAGGSCVGKPANCDDGNSCTDDSCDVTSGCNHVANAAACDDGDPCTLAGTCAQSQCVVAGYACSTDLPCHTAFCQAKTGECTIKTDADGATCGGKLGTCGAGACVATGANATKWGLVPAGTFWMGCNGALDTSCSNDEKPQHEVNVTKPYWLAVDEVTVEQYKACVTAGTCQAASTYDAHCNWGVPGREKHPINCVPWGDAQAYCKWLGGTLPTEAQWEMAARGRCDENGGISGCSTKMRVYPWGDESPICGKHGVLSGPDSGCGTDLTWPVGTGSLSGVGPYGMRDLAGNVWEWVADWSTAYTSAKVVHELGGIGGASGTTRGARGGAFNSKVADLRGARRGAGEATAAIYFVGFRCVNKSL